jgi:pimeloyl-ACP methyl ester carboxylesterase
MPMSELPEDVKQEYYTFLPIQELSEIVGEDDVYYFGYDSLGDIMKETENLHHYIHDVVLPKSPNGKVKLCHISLGGTIAINYLETYPEDYELIKKMVFVIPAIDGSDVIGDLFTGNLSVFYDDNTLYEDLLVTLLGETPLAYFLNIVLRILPDDVLKSALSGLANGLVDIAAVRSTMLWALCPDAYYQEARAMWLENNDDLAHIGAIAE